MDKDLRNIEDLFKSALDDNEEMPAAKVWEAVDKRLDKDTVVTIKKKYNILKRFSLLLLFLLTGVAIYELSSRYRHSDVAKSNNTETGKANEQDNDGGNKKQIDGNSVASKEKNNLTEINDITIPAVRDNSNNNKATSGNNNQVQSRNSFKTAKQNHKEVNADARFFVNNPSVSKIYHPLIKKPNAQRLIRDLTGADKHNVLLQTTSLHINDTLLVLWLNTPAIENTNRLTNARPDTKNLLQPSASAKNTPSIDIKTTAQQQVKKKAVKPSRFSISGSFSPDIASYRLEDDDTPNQPDNSSQIKKTERHEFSSTTGVMMEYELNKKWTLQTGLSFSNTNIAIEPKTIYAQPDNNGDVKYRLNISSGYGYIVPAFQPSPSIGDSLKVTAATHKLRYVGIPLAVKYRITNGKLIIEAMAGVSINFLTMGKLETEIQKGANNEIDILDNIEGLKKIYPGGLAGIGAEYKFTGKVSFILMPAARFALIPINKGGVVKTYPYSLGLSAGLKIKF
jgi:Outer membrane protein beta-barrel domain